MEHDKIETLAAELLSLKGKAAIVTGAGSGIGRGIARRLAEMGAAVAVLDKNAESAAETAGEIERRGGSALTVQCDLRVRSDCRRAVEQTLAAYKRIDILCNNAGIAIRKDTVTLEEDEWDLVLDVTLKAVYLLSREVIPHMIAQGGGAIVNTRPKAAL
jgi:NAD(P)-dependent dehydrogenase (short-subunit alcohol dehydrogenase family)